MKNLLTVIIVALVSVFAIDVSAQDAVTAWKEVYPKIEKAIVAPVFKNQDYDIRDFGAVANDSTKLNHEAINRAIATCSINGGGRVVVSEGVWHTGPITLKSDVNLFLKEGATLLFTTDTKYFPTVLTRWEGCGLL